MFILGRFTRAEIRHSIVQHQRPLQPFFSLACYKGYDYLSPGMDRYDPKPRFQIKVRPFAFFKSPPLFHDSLMYD